MSKAVGVVSPEKGVMAKIRKGMVGKCLSPVFRAVLYSMESDLVREGLEENLESGRWDATILQEKHSHKIQAIVLV